MTTVFDDCSPSELETVVADIWTDRGWTTTVADPGRDGGVDVIAQREQPYQEKVLIQVKHYDDDNPVGAPEIQQYAGLQHQHPDADSVIVATSSDFTQPARETAADANVKLVDGTELADMAADAGLLQTTSSDRSTTSSNPTSERTPGEGVSVPTPTVDAIQEVARIVIMLFVIGYMAYILWNSGAFF